MGHDATPRIASFGGHVDSVREFARYVVDKDPDEGKGCKLVDLATLRGMKGLDIGWRPKFGVAEVFAQLHTLHFQRQSSLQSVVYIHENRISPPSCYGAQVALWFILLNVVAPDLRHSTSSL